MAKMKKPREDFSVKSPNNGYGFDLPFLLAESKDKQAEAKTVRRIAIVLSCLCNGIDTLSKISEQTDLSRSTVYRLLKGLEKSHFVIQDPTKKQYHLGSLIRYLVSKPEITHDYLVTCAKPDMLRLSSLTDETVVLSVKIGYKHITMDTIPGTQDMRVVEPSRNYGPLYLGASGKVLLSQLNDKEIKEIINNPQFGIITESEKKELLSSIKKIRLQGYAISIGERLLGGSSIAAPIFGYTIPVTLEVIGPYIRMQPKLQIFVKRLIATTERISRIISDGSNV